MSGWIKLHRQLQEHWIWTMSDPFDPRSAWIDLIFLANYKDVKVREGETVKTYPRGTVNMSLLALADRWKWSRGKVRRFVNSLESDGMVTVNSTTHGTTITIVNYSNFQDSRPADDTTDGQQTDNRRTQVKKEKESKRNNNSARARRNSFLDFFQRDDDLNAYIAQEARDG